MPEIGDAVNRIRQAHTFALARTRRRSEARGGVASTHSFVDSAPSSFMPMDKGYSMPPHSLLILYV